MAQRNSDDETASDEGTLTETQVALMLRHADDLALMPAVEAARALTVSEWQRTDDGRADKLARLRDNEHYDFNALGWQIYDDYGQTPAVRMVVVTPVPGWEESNLDEITREFIYAWKDRTIQNIETLRQQVALPRNEFTALLVDVLGDGDIAALDEPLERTANQLRADLANAKGAADPVVDEVLYGNAGYGGREEPN